MLKAAGWSHQGETRAAGQPYQLWQHDRTGTILTVPDPAIPGVGTTQYYRRAIADEILRNATRSTAATPAPTAPATPTIRVTVTRKP